MAAAGNARTATASPERVPEGTDWHAQTTEALFARLGASAAGLASTEAQRRLLAHGRNVLPEPPPRHPLLRFLSHFRSVLIYFLLLAAAAAWALGDALDAAVIAAVVLLNATIGFVQEGRAEQALKAIRAMVAPHASVWRDGRRETVDVGDIVPGDAVILEAGDRVPADLRLVETRGLMIEQAALTGESVPAEKATAALPVRTELADRACMAYAGTWALAGRGVGIAVATGARTELGRISKLVANVVDLKTPLLRQLDDFGRRFTWIAIGTAALMFGFAVLLRGYAWHDALLAVVALAVGAVPEGLPAVITICLAVGVRRMAARNAVIRRLPAVETLGSTSVICTDKTGTLTRNEMVARRIVVAGHAFDVQGSGYAPQGRILAAGADSPHDLQLALPLLQAAVLCNDAQLHRGGGEWHVQGDPMEGALLALAGKAGVTREALSSGWRRLDEIPFDSRHRLMATVHRGAAGERLVSVKGAPERLLELCDHEQSSDGARPIDRARWSAEVARAAAAGERVLAFASKRLRDGESLTLETLAERLLFLGIVGLIDPPREDAAAAIGECRSAGIRVKMITGDHPSTAGAIARQLAIAPEPRITTGAEVEAAADSALRSLVHHVDVFARTSPEHKLRIVRALQADGERVAMTGDGVNDAPALKQADVGVAMGRKGTEAAKEASEMVLLDDRFASIVAAVREGRTVYDNIRKIVVWTLPADGGEILLVIAAILIGFTLPITPTQILWINLVTTVALGLVLAFEPSEPNVMRRPPRPPAAPLLSAFLLWRVGFVAMLFTAAGLAIFFYALARGDALEMARTLVVNTIVVLEIFYLFNVRYLHMRSITWTGALCTPAVLIGIGVTLLAQAAFTYAPFMQVLFATRAVSLQDGMLIIGLGVALFLLLELEKSLLRRWRIFDDLER